MKPFAVFGAQGAWFRGNCHTHTTLSDGKQDPKDTAAAYRKRGYDFLVLTDHGKAHDDVESLTDKGFLVIRGAEMHPRPQCGGFDHHFIALGVKTSPPKSAMKTAQSAIRWGKRQGALVYYCHPYWTGHGMTHLEEGREAIGLEVYNATCDVWRGLGYSEVHWDQVLSRGWRWPALAVDDTHRSDKDGFLGWVMVKAKRLDRRNILDALRKGYFYSTQGPEIKNISMKNGVITLNCSPAVEVVWHGNGPCGTRIAAGPDQLIEQAVFEPKSSATTYLRAMVRDSCDRKAWSNPIWRDPKSGQWVG